MTLRTLWQFSLISALALAGVCLPEAPPASAGKILDPQAITQTTLPNGLRVVIKEAPGINLVALNVWVRAGSSDETEENNGVSHFLEHLMFKGTKKRAPGDFDMEVEGLCGIANATTTEDATQYYIVVARQHAEKALDALGDVMSNPAFPEGQIEQEKGIIQNELKRASESPERVLTDWMNRLSFERHPYRLPTAGSLLSVRQINRAKILSFYEKYYVAANMSVVVVGAVKASEILPKIQAAFGGLRAGTVPDRARTPEPVPDRVRHRILDEQTQRGYVMIGYRAPGMDTPEDVCAMDVLLYLLGEERAQSGRLNRELRQKRGLVSSVYGDYITLREPGIVTFTAETEPAKIETVKDAILQQIAQVRDGLVPDDEVRSAKMLLLGVYTLDNETYDGQAGTLGFYEAKDTYQFALDYADRVQKVTAADIQRVARKYFPENGYSLVIIRPKPAAGVVRAAPAPAGSAGSMGSMGSVGSMGSAHSPYSPYSPYSWLVARGEAQ